MREARHAKGRIHAGAGHPGDRTIDGESFTELVAEGLEGRTRGGRNEGNIINAGRRPNRARGDLLHSSRHPGNKNAHHFLGKSGQQLVVRGRGQSAQVGIADGADGSRSWVAGSQPELTNRFTSPQFDRQCFLCTIFRQHPNSTAENDVKGVARVSLQEQELATVERHGLKGHFQRLAKCVTEWTEEFSVVEGSVERLALQSRVDQVGKGKARVLILIRNFTQRFPGDDAYQGISATRKVNGMRLGPGIPVQEHSRLRFQFSNCFSGRAGDRHFSRQNNQNCGFGCFRKNEGITVKAGHRKLVDELFQGRSRDPSENRQKGDSLSNL